MNPISEIDGSTTQASSLRTMGTMEESRLESGDLGQDARGGRLEACPTSRGRRCLGTIACLVVAFSLAGCSTFEQDWRAARLIPRLEDDLAGRWEGTWLSKGNGHNDQLRAIIATGSNGVYLTRFHARYKKGLLRFSFGYSVPLQATLTNDAYQFHGEADLGWLAGGRYRYEGSATGTNFFSTYHCKYDHGTFQMRRPSGANSP